MKKQKFLQQLFQLILTDFGILLRIVGVINLILISCWPKKLKILNIIFLLTLKKFFNNKETLPTYSIKNLEITSICDWNLFGQISGTKKSVTHTHTHTHTHTQQWYWREKLCC